MRNNDKKGRAGNRSGGGRQKPYFSHEERDSDKPQRSGRSDRGRDGDEGERRSYGAKRGDRNDDKRSGSKGFGRKRDEQADDRGERKTFRKSDSKSTGERKTFGRKRDDSDDRSERKSFRKDDDKRTGERKSFGRKRDDGDERSERKSFRKDDDRGSRERKSFGEKSERSFDKKRSYGDDKAFGRKRDESDDRERKSSRSNEDKRTRKGYGEEAGAKKRSYDDGRKKTSGRRERDTEDFEFSEEKSFQKGNGRRPATRRSKDDEEGLVRLNRYLANAGIASRREADELIKSGVVSVNGKIVTEMGFKVKPGDVVRYNNETLKRERLMYVLLNKPKDYITTADDPSGRKTVLELVQGAGKERIYPVGRLDRATTGLLLLTNDGDLTKRLTHPRYGVRKIYHVELDKNVKPSDIEKIMEGIELEDGMIQADDVAYVGDGADKAQVGIELHSGKNRIVRRIFEHLGYNVRKLDRVMFAGLTKKDLPRGRWRHLTEKEVGMLYMVSQDKK